MAWKSTWYLHCAILSSIRIEGLNHVEIFEVPVAIAAMNSRSGYGGDEYQYLGGEGGGFNVEGVKVCGPEEAV